MIIKASVHPEDIKNPCLASKDMMLKLTKVKEETSRFMIKVGDLSHRAWPAASFVIVPNWKQPQCQSADAWILQCQIRVLRTLGSAKEGGTNA